MIFPSRMKKPQKKKGYALSLVLKVRVFWNLEMAYILAYTDCILITPLFHLKVKRISFSVLIINVFNRRRQALSLISESVLCLCTCCVTTHFTINFLIHVCLSDSPAWPEGRDCTARARGSHNARKAFWGNPETEVSVPKREKNLSKGIWWKDTGNGSTGLTGEYWCKLLNRCTLVVQRVET